MASEAPIDAPRVLLPAERLRRNLETANREASRPYQLSVSLGAAAYDPRRPCSLEELIERADQAMYDDKRRRQLERR